MPIIAAQNLSMGFLDKTIFSSACFSIEPTDKVGLIGSNGAGKTTLFRLINRELTPTQGELVIGSMTKIGNVEQHTCEESSRTAYQEVLTVFDWLEGLELELNELHSELERETDSAKAEALIARQAELTEIFQDKGGLNFRTRARAALLGLGFTREETEQKTSSLSGGQKTKVSLAKLLLSDADLILLDEPTNHLDLDSVEWLEDFLRRYKGAAVIISHDRWFLDRVTNKTMEIEHRRVTMTSGSYSEFARQKALREETQRRVYDKTTKEIKRIEGIVRQQRSFARERNFITAASKQKQIDRLKAELVEPDAQEAGLKLSFPLTEQSGNDVLTVDSISKAYQGKTLFSNASFNVQRGERIFLLGPNGCGKTTLLKILMARQAADSGFVKYGSNVKIGYFEQIRTTTYSQKSVLDEVYDSFPNYSLPELRKYLAAFLFRGDDVFKSMSQLSGGERAKIALLKIMLKGPNLLVLDEPTNHLDIKSREALEQALLAYEGTIICVSHDRYFINSLADKIYAFDGEGLVKLDGGYDSYIETVKQSEDRARSEKPPKVNEYKLRKERESQERRRKSQIKKLEEEIAVVDSERDEIAARLSEPEVAADYIMLSELTTKLDELSSRQEELYEQWLLLSEE